MKRKIYRELKEWKSISNGSSALLIEGARRIGKSYIVEEFAKNEYDSYIMINFRIASRDVKSWFDIYLEDIHGTEHRAEPQHGAQYGEMLYGRYWIADFPCL